jgi:hypothetical protein
VFNWSGTGDFASGNSILDASGNYYGTVTTPVDVGSWSITFVFSTTGHSRTVYYSTYSESAYASPSSVTTGTSVNIYLGGGVPNSDFSFSGAASGQSSLDASGGYTFSGIQYTPGTYTYSVLFIATGALRQVGVVVTAPVTPPPPPNPPPPCPPSRTSPPSSRPARSAS